MPAGVFDIGERPVQSDTLDVHLPDAIHRCVIRGTLDVVVKLDDGGYALVDLVIGEGERLMALDRRLQACAYALEHPAADVPLLGPITRLGAIEIPRDDSRLFVSRRTGL
jgi:hypothetical protein